MALRGNVGLNTTIVGVAMGLGFGYWFKSADNSRKEQQKAFYEALAKEQAKKQ